LRETRAYIDHASRSCEDPLTGLPNRSQIEQEVHNALTVSARSGVDFVRGFGIAVPQPFPPKQEISLDQANNL
jgi:GGDEF domain-containing protein